jgi:hypothetical protein
MELLPRLIKVLSAALDSNASTPIDGVEDEILNIQHHFSSLSKKRPRDQSTEDQIADQLIEPSAKKSFTLDDHRRNNEVMSSENFLPPLTVDFECRRKKSANGIADLCKAFNVDIFKEFLSVRKQVDDFCIKFSKEMHQGSFDYIASELQTQNYVCILKNKHALAYFFAKLCEPNKRSVRKNFAVFSSIIENYHNYLNGLCFCFKTWGDLVSPNNPFQWVGGIDVSTFAMSTISNWYKISKITEYFVEIEIDGVNYSVPS